MSTLTVERARTLLADLIALPSVNPMGRPWSGDAPVERPVTEYLERLFAPYDRVRRERQTISAMHESLLITLPGRTDAPATLFESHMDTVPADDWADRAFTPRIEGNRIIGRGACDDKGCLAAMALAVLDLLESGEVPAAPVQFLAAGDEEHAQTGIKHFRDRQIPVGRGIFGEPTRLIPIVQHKGTIRWDITVHGKSAHTSRPELGENAIYAMMRVIETLRAHEAQVRRQFSSPLLTGPAITVSMIQGGRTRNAVPDACTVAVDYRMVPGMDPWNSRAGAIAALEPLGLRITHAEPQLFTPPLNTPLDHPFAQQVLSICRAHAGAAIELAGEPYGTDAAWMADRAPCLVLGPGSIATAHAVDEEIDIPEVLTCARIYRDILLGAYDA